ncbi:MULTISPECIES: TlpA disulfide reductase family protein [Flavobacterium]|uniref:TlpA disulfide reductase family protein n=1 Tax=Flavobacterium TaxID=237 RepID=UPI0011829C1A|nr:MULTISPECIES: TlpA disulfide reductase family protein [Flavobacterium]MCR4033579.1 TlpA family protein disulfide reductase [Flavobacterium panacis]
MKKIYILLFLTVVNSLFSQNGKIYLKNSKFKVGAENTYVYEPPKGLIIEENYKANFITTLPSEDNSTFKKLVKKGKNYEFTTKVADSARTLLVVIINGQKMIDTNNDQGYIVYLKTQNEVERSKTLANEIVIKGYGNYVFKLKTASKPEDQIVAYEKLFEKYPSLKSDKAYMSYLYQKFNVTQGKNNEENLAFAAKCLEKNTEEYLMMALNLYDMNKMPEEKDKLEKEILAKYPTGMLATNKFLTRFASHPNKTEDYILKSIDTCKTKFKDQSKGALSRLYYNLVDIYLGEKNLEKAIAVESNMYDPEYIYNNLAWKLSGGGIETPTQDLDFAIQVSKRSLDILEKKSNEEFYAQYQNQFNMFADTYALLLYKKGDYEEAFKYQDSVRKAGGLDAGGKERYLVMLEKVKSRDEVKKYVEDEINSDGVLPAGFLCKLKEIYIAENRPLAEYEIIKEKADQKAKAARSQDVINKFGSATAFDFTLKNLEGKDVKLSDYRGKVVILDFWATWCGPCKASFPKMQELVNKYKDKEVTFLFVNTFENKKEDEVLKNVTAYMTEKKYNFNVVFDSKTEVGNGYKIQSIPTRILISKDGNILFSDNSNTNLGELIDEQLK